MKKKLLLEKQAALKSEYAGLLAQNPDDAIAHLALCETKSAELEKVKQELAAIEALEALAVQNLSATQTEPARVIRDNAAERPFATNLEFFQAVRMAGMPTASREQWDPRLHRLALGSNESTPSEGGFLVQTGESAELFQRSYEVGTLARYARALPISSNSNGTKINGVDESSRATGSRYGGVRGYWASEASTVTAATPKFRQIKFELNKLFALAYATEEVLADAVQLASFIRSTVPQEIAFLRDVAIFSGTGAGQPLGILTSDAKVSVAKETSQTAATINATNLAKMLARMWAPSLPNARWFFNQECQSQLPLLTVGDQPVYLPPNGLAGAPNGLLFGRPIEYIEQCEALGTQGDVMLADMSQYGLATKAEINAQESMHVRFVYDEMCFRFTLRTDGRPMWNTALTPFKGSATQSPFVFLDTRA